MMKSKRSMKFIATFVMMLFLFQFFAPLVQTGIGHTPEECQKLYDKWKKKNNKAKELNKELKELESDQIYTIVKKALLDATIGGLLVGGGAWAIFKETVEHAIKKSSLWGFSVTGIWSIINTYRSTQAEIDKVQEKLDKTNKEAKKLWEKYLECMDHNHASGSLSPYMDVSTYVRYGDTHTALFQASVPYDSVWWYVRAPGESGYGTNVSTEQGDGAKLSSTFDFTAPHTVGTYTITAYVYFSNTIIEQSYDVTVSAH